MARLRRRWRILKWMGTALGVLVFTTWAISTKWSIGYVGSPVCIDVIRGGVTVDRFRALDGARCRPSMHGYWRVITLHRVDPPVWRPSLGIWYEGSLGRVWVFILPLWIPFALLAIPTGILWCCDRRRLPPGRCPNCGSDLTGNVSGVCPECGEPTSDRDNRSGMPKNTDGDA